MIHSAGGELRCAHALLEEASLGLIPSSVAALLHARIAAELEAECTASSYPAALTWAAAEHWIAIGDIAAAARLLRHCASQAAALGEPSTGAQALLHIPLHLVGLAERASILNQLVEYAEAASEFRQAADALRSLHQASIELNRSPEVLRELQLHIMEAELRHGACPTPAIQPLKGFVSDANTPSSLRIRAGASLLIVADMSLDEPLAVSTYQAIKPELDKCSPSIEAWQRAQLVFHTVFGDQDHAFKLANSLLEQYVLPTISQAAVRNRRNIAYALMRLGWLDLAKEVLVADYEFMMSRHVTTEAVYRMILLAEISVAQGNLKDAKLWIDRVGKLVAQDGACGAAMQAGHFSIAAELALRENRLDEAEAFVDAACRNYPAISSARYSAVELSQRLRIYLVRDRRPVHGEMVSKLKDLYGRGRHLGAQDSVVEALWLAEVSAGRAGSASNLLCDYLSVRRRESRAPEWALRSTTASDPVWRDFVSGGPTG
jgi:tetratricopeptide (TPR) repeat protein